jgi:transcriptional regulator with XRE-family HTH domain
MPTADFYQNLGKTIREHRQAHGQTRQQLADQIGLSRASVVNIEAGRQAVYVDTLILIAVALEKPIEVFLPVRPTRDWIFL